MGKKGYLTVKEYAEIKGVSVQAVYKKLKTSLQPYVETVEGRKMLRSEVLRENFNPKFSTIQPDSTPLNVEKDSTFFEKSLTSSEKGWASSCAELEELKRKMKWDEELIEDLRIQIKEKDKLLQNQTEQILDLSKRMADITENNQKLQLSYQLLLNGNSDDVETFSARGRAEDEPEPIEVKGKGIFNRLFRNK